MPRWLSQIVTEPDNRTVCIVRILSVVGAGEFFVLAAKTAVKSGTFDMQSFGIGFGTLLGGIGAALKLKKDSPDEKTTGPAS